VDVPEGSLETGHVFDRVHLIFVVPGNNARQEENLRRQGNEDMLSEGRAAILVDSFLGHLDLFVAGSACTSAR
jgi:hypothetical protein